MPPRRRQVVVRGAHDRVPRVDRGVRHGGHSHRGRRGRCTTRGNPQSLVGLAEAMGFGRTPPISAPDLTGPASFLDWPTSMTPVRGHRRAPPFSHVRLEIDLQPEIVRDPGLKVFERLEALLKEREVVEIGDLLRLTARALHAFSSLGFSRVDHWEVEPGGWLPLPEASHARSQEPLGHLLKALEDEHWKGLAARRSFSVRLSGRGAMRADLNVRRVHRERRHSLTVDLHGRFTKSDVHGVIGALAQRLPVLHATVAAYARQSATSE